VTLIADIYLFINLLIFVGFLAGLQQIIWVKLT